MSWRGDLPVVNIFGYGTAWKMSNSGMSRAAASFSGGPHFFGIYYSDLFEFDAVGTLMDPRITIKMLVIYKRIQQGPFF